MSKRRLRKDRLLFLLLILFLLIILIISIINKLRIKSYSLEYEVSETSISENYDKKKKYYYYKLTYNNLSYDFIYESDYIEDRKLISSIKKYTTDDETCLIVKSDYINPNPLCSINDYIVYYHLISDDLFNKIKKYTKKTTPTEIKLNNYIIYNTEDTKIIWNYKGINIIKDNKIESVNIFKKDFYEVPISTLINNYFIVADYEENYNIIACAPSVGCCCGGGGGAGRVFAMRSAIFFEISATISPRIAS